MRKAASAFFLMILVMSLFTGIFLYPQSRGLRVRIKNLNADNEVGKQYLVLIAINRYQNWTPLKGPVKDAEDIRKVLESRYYIDNVLKLYDEDATKGRIIKLLRELQEKLKQEDSVFIFYAGHGHLDDASNLGYWIPIDGGLDENKQENWISNVHITGLIGKMKSKHILLILDSCFSGDILETRREKPPTINNEYFKKAYKRRSRQILTSGASERVPDSSNFARQLTLALKENKKPYLDTSVLYNEIRLAITDTLPLFGILPGVDHQKGASFLLFLKGGPERSESTSKPEVSSTIAGIQLRTYYKAFSLDDVKAMLKERGFFDRDLNDSGNFENNYKSQTIQGDRVVVDNATGLMWHQSGPSKSMKYEEAKQWIKNLNRKRYAGYDGWRFPTLEEGASLLESGKNMDDLYIDPRFSGVQKYIWTGDTFIGSSRSKASWVVFFGGGCIFISYHQNYGYVRPVRLVY